MLSPVDYGRDHMPFETVSAFDVVLMRHNRGGIGIKPKCLLSAGHAG